MVDYSYSRFHTEQTLQRIRPRMEYPGLLIDFLAEHCGLSQVSLIAEIGSGDSGLTPMLLEKRCSVYGIEADSRRRRLQERELRDHEFFHSIEGDHRDTGLRDNHVCFVFAVDPFRWYAKRAVRQELKRILVPGGWVCLLWNFRKKLSSPFLENYEKMLTQYCTLYERINRATVDENRLDRLFAPGDFNIRAFDSTQLFDFPALRDKLLLSPYAPPRESALRRKLLERMRAVFEEFQEEGSVRIEYRTQLYYGQLD